MLSSTFSSGVRFARTMLPRFSEIKHYSASVTDKIGNEVDDPDFNLHHHAKLPPLPVTFEDVSKATFMIRKGILHTPCDYSTALSELCKTNVYLKKDFMQFTGSFKERGARYSLMSLNAAEKKKGVVLASAGNHALAMAWHGA